MMRFHDDDDEYVRVFDDVMMIVGVRFSHFLGVWSCVDGDLAVLECWKGF